MKPFYAFDLNFTFVGEVQAATCSAALDAAKAKFPKSSGLMIHPKPEPGPGKKVLNGGQLEIMFQTRSGLGPGSWAQVELPPINLHNMPTPGRRRHQ